MTTVVSNRAQHCPRAALVLLLLLTGIASLASGVTISDYDDQSYVGTTQSVTRLCSMSQAIPTIHLEQSAAIVPKALTFSRSLLQSKFIIRVTPPQGYNDIPLRR